MCTQTRCKREAAPGKKTCQHHLDQHKQCRKQIYYTYATRKLCVEGCGSYALPDRVRCDACRIKTNRRQRVARAAKKRGFTV